jgi:Zn-dependent protease with chaperone function
MAATDTIDAHWFDGRQAEARPVRLQFQQGQLRLQASDGTQRQYPRRQVVWPERTRHGQRQLLLPDGGVLQLYDAAAWDRWAAAAGLQQPLAARWALYWPLVLGALVLLLATVFAAWRWGIPWGARTAAGWVPASLEQRLGRELMDDLGERGWIQPSQLPERDQQRILAAAARMVAAAYPEGAPRHQLHLRQGPKWLGPNAFALPGGDIVVTDALVQLLRDGDEPVSGVLLGVIAHELGHVREQHGLRLVFEAGAVSVLMGWWIGDFSSLMAAAPALMMQAGYSRGHERAADAEALRVMRAAGIDPREMVRFFTRLKEELPKRDGDTPMFGLATHPTDSERVLFFGQGGR